MADRFCRKQREYFSDVVDGRPIPFWRALLVRCHLTICPPCKRIRASLEATRAALGDLRDSDPDVP